MSFLPSVWNGIVAITPLRMGLLDESNESTVKNNPHASTIFIRRYAITLKPREQPGLRAKPFQMFLGMIYRIEYAFKDLEQEWRERIRQ